MNLVWNWWGVPGTLVLIGAWACAVLAIRTAPHKPLNRHLSIVLILEGLFVGCNLGILFFFENRGVVQVLAICGTAALVALPFQYLSFLAVALKTPLVTPFNSRTASIVLGAVSVFGAILVLTNPQLFISELYSPDFAPWNFRYERIGIWAVQFHGAVAFFGLIAATSAYISAGSGLAATNRAKWFAISFGLRDIFLGITLMLYPVIRPIPFWGDFLINPGTALIYFIYVLLLAYAVLKIQLFDIHLKVKFVIQKGTVVALVGGMFLVGSEMLEALLPMQSTILGIVVALVILALLKPIHWLALRLVGGIMQEVEETDAYLEVRKIEVYRAAFEGAMEDGIVTQKEKAILKRLRQKLELSEKDAELVEQNFAPRIYRKLTIESLFHELKRRNLDKIALAYVLLSWVFLLTAETLFPAIELPDSIARILAITLFFGFPLALLFGWAFEWTRQGIKKTQSANPEASVTIRRRDYVLNAVLLLFIGVVGVQQFTFINRPIEAVLVTLVDDKSIAVLPFANLSPDPDNDYFAAGVHEEILNQLAKISEIKVVSRTAVLRYQDTAQSPSEIARELNVSTILEGSVRFADNRVRITMQLVRATDDIQLWAETYQFELEDIFAIQSDVALQVADSLEATLIPTEIDNIESPATENMEAYTLFLQHRYQSEQERLRSTLDPDGWVESGLRKMQRAVALDPMFAVGFAELGYLEWFKGTISPPAVASELFDEALAHANKAIELNPSIARAYVVLHEVSSERRQWEAWENYARKSVELPDPDGRAALNFAANLLLIERYEEANRWFDIGISKNPSLALFREYALLARIFSRDYETALEKAEQYYAVGGDENAYHIARAFIFSRLERESESRDELSRVIAEPMGTSSFIPGFYDFLRCQSGELQSVMREIEQVEIDLVNEVRTIYCAAGAGDLDAMIEGYQRSMNRGGLIYFGDLVSEELRADPRFQAVEEYMNLPKSNSQRQ